MPKFAANLTMLFQEAPFLDRFKLATEAGFKYIEYLFPYEYAPETLAAKLDELGLEQVLFNLPPGNWQEGERGIACLPDRTEEFKTGVSIAIAYAKALNVKQLNCLAGIAPSNVKHDRLWETMKQNLQYAADQLAQHNITLLIEPINTKIDMPGFFIDTLEKGLQLIRQTERENIKLQFDLYHMQIMQGDLIRSLKNNIKHVQHIQFADNPGRHEPGTGEINFAKVFEVLDQIGYTGWVSAEYIPSQNTRHSLSWLRTFN